MEGLYVNDAQIGSWASFYLWPLFRVTAFFSVVPIFGAKTVPVRVRAAMSFVFTLLLVPVLPTMPVIEAINVANFLIIAEQIAVGTVLGLIVQMVFQMFVLTGQTIAMQMGLGFASMVDPSNGVSIAVMSQWYLTLVTLLFLAINGHLIVIDVLVQSFYLKPVGSGFFSANNWYELASFATWMFVASLTISLPAITALLMINLTFGILTRSAPQLNVFSLGFPITMIGGIAIVWLTFSNVIPLMDQFVNQMLQFMHGLLQTS